MTYRGPFASIIQNAAIMPRVHATASRRALVTSASCDLALSRTTLAVASYSPNTSMSVAKNSRRFFGGRQARCVRINAPIIVSSTDGAGMSSSVEGGRSARSGMTLSRQAPPGAISVSQSDVAETVKPSLGVFPRIHGQQIVADQWFLIQPGWRMALADGPNGYGSSSHAYRSDLPLMQKGGLLDRPSCSASILRGQTPQRRRRISVLRPCRALATLGSPQVFVARYPNPPLKAYPDNLAHLSAFLKATPALEASST